MYITDMELIKLQLKLGQLKNEIAINIAKTLNTIK